MDNYDNWFHVIFLDFREIWFKKLVSSVVSAEESGQIELSLELSKWSKFRSHNKIAEIDKMSAIGVPQNLICLQF